MPRVAALPFLALLTGCSVFGDPTGIERTLRVHDDHAVQVAALVVDLGTGETLVSREADRTLRPASTMKLLPTAAVCRRDPDGVIATTLVADGMAEAALTLIGGGDPFLSAAELRDLVRELHRQGVRRASGALTVVDPIRDGDRFGEGWMWDDEPSAFMPPLTAVPVDGACVAIVARRAANGELAVELQPVAGTFRLEVIPGEGALRVSRGIHADSDLVTVRGTVDGDRTVRRRISAPDPAAYTGAVLAAALRDEGMLAGDAKVVVRATVPEFDPTARRAVHRRPMAEALARTNKPSDNLGAELLLRHLGALAPEHHGLDAQAVTRGIDAVHADIAALGFDPTRFRIADGSGVSHYDLVSASLLVAQLVDMHRRGGRAFDAFRTSLPIAGVDGTLSDRMRGTAAEGRVYAKTGTISGVSNLAGYIDTASGRHLAFAILVQNFVGSAAEWRALQDALCAQLAAL